MLQARLQLSSWPFVHSVDGSLEMDAGVASLFATSFAEEQPDEFVVAHQAFVHLEETRELGDYPYDWAARGRIAFYLAATDSSRSVNEFGSAFAEPATFAGRRHGSG